MGSAGWDAIVIGSGIGGLTAAAALAKRSRRVLVLERHSQLGGMTQTFRRREYAFAPAVHYIGGVGDASGPDNQFGRLLRRLTDGRLHFASIGSPYDIVRLPGLEFPIETPREAYIARLKATFPDEIAAIDRYFEACGKAQGAIHALFASRALPAPLGLPMRWLNAGRVRVALQTTAADAVRAIRDRRLAALLCARWGDYGLPPERAPLALHALVTGSYFAGAYYPIGGPGQFARALATTIQAGGGELRTDATVSEIRVERSRAAGVRLAGGESLDADIVISDMGAHNTVAALPATTAPEWQKAIGMLKPSISYLSLYIGFRGDIRAQGASAANVWVYESEDVGRLWERPADDEAPSMFVTFPSLKDPAHADAQHHTAEVAAFCSWEPFAQWAGSEPGRRPEEYEANKAWITESLLAQFKRHFPRLAPLIDFAELSTPLSQAAYIGAQRGAAYGLEMTAERLRSAALGVRTPIPGLLLAGQDALSLGVPGAFMGGYMAAASLEPRLWLEMGR